MPFTKGAKPFGGKGTPAEEQAEAKMGAKAGAPDGDGDMDDETKGIKGRIDKRNARSKRPGKKVKNPSGLAMQISKMKKGCK